MKQLSSCGRSNIVYGLAKGLGMKRADGSNYLFPSNKVITGLFEYCVQFFNAGNNTQHVRRYKTYVYESCITNSLFVFKVVCPKDYRLWLVTMYSLFGNKRLNLPVWKVECTEQDGHIAPTDTKQSTNVIHFISITI